MTDRELIEKHGGTKAFAKLLDVSVQRVTNWKRRGIPAKVKLENLAVFNLAPLKNTQQKTPSDN